MCIQAASHRLHELLRRVYLQPWAACGVVQRAQSEAITSLARLISALRAASSM